MLLDQGPPARLQGWEGGQKRKVCFPSFDMVCSYVSTQSIHFEHFKACVNPLRAK